MLVTPASAQAWNPAFDVVPCELIDGIVSELGVATAAGSRSDAGFALPQWVESRRSASATKLEVKEEEWKEADGKGGANAVKVQA